MNNLLANRTLDFEPENDFSGDILCNDLEYEEYVKLSNGGFYYNNSLHFFGSSLKNKSHDIGFMNDLLKMSYGEIVNGLFFFGEDVFGNMFAFKNDEVYSFNIESAKMELIAQNFKDFLVKLEEDLDYLTGISFVKELTRDQVYQLAYGHRITPKYPFVLGGDYSIENMILKDYEENIEFNSSIAKQIYDLPDGTKIEIDFKS
ncbi:MAG: SMI1/KNR4 family protein [Bacteroidota bacterium]